MSTMTGYTAGIFDGRIQTFEQFALVCARAFGWLSSMREESLSAPLPERIEPDQYYASEAAESRAKFEAMKARSPKAWGNAYAAAKKSRADRNAERRAEFDRAKHLIGFLRRDADGWTPPEPWAELKGFMLNQLSMSEATFYEEPALPEFEVWVADEVVTAAERLSRAERNLANQIERAAKATAALNELRASLKARESA